MSVETSNVLIIPGPDIRRVMGLADYLESVELAFQAAAMGKASSPTPMHLQTSAGAFHTKGASISLGRDYVAVKTNGNFPDNPAKLGLPTIQGAILLFDGRNGRLLAILDSIEVTIQRTAAASALAARALARADAKTLLVCGCGEQGRAHIAMLRQVLALEKVVLWDGDPARSAQLAAEMGAETAQQLESAAGSADVIVTCTTSTAPFLHVGMIGPGTFIAAVGADNPTKSEIAPALMASAKVVTDVIDQCASMGDLHHAIATGAMGKGDVHAELAELLAGARAGRTASGETFVFDSTGTGLQDVTSAAAIYERCRGDDSILSIALSGA